MRPQPHGAWTHSTKRSRLIYRPRGDDGRRDGRRSFSWRDYRDLLIAAHQQLGDPTSAQPEDAERRMELLVDRLAIL